MTETGRERDRERQRQKEIQKNRDQGLNLLFHSLNALSNWVCDMVSPGTPKHVTNMVAEPLPNSSGHLHLWEGESETGGSQIRTL